MKYLPEIADFVEAAVEGARAQTTAHAAWGFGDEDSWSMDQESGQIEFEFSDGRIASAEAQIVGTYNPGDGTFLWSWDHDSIEEALREHAKLVYEFGVENSVSPFTERKVICTEYEAWEFTAVAARLGSANGVYRADAGGPFVFFTFGEIRIHKSDP